MLYYLSDEAVELQHLHGGATQAFRRDRNEGVSMRIPIKVFFFINIVDVFWEGYIFFLQKMT